MYIACGASVAGTRHTHGDRPCEDAWSAVTHSDALILAIADGLSSAPCGGTGATIAVSTSVMHAADLLKADETQDPADVLLNAFSTARETIEQSALSCGREISDYATTLLVTILTHDEVICGHIGDGACVTVLDSELSVLSPPGKAEYANETASLTRKNWRQVIRISSGTADAVLCTTDGCQGALIRHEQGSYVPYGPFIIPLVRSLERFAHEERDLNTEIADLLSSPRMQALSSDDMTLAVGFITGDLE